MAIRIIRLGSPRSAGEGLRLGTVRRPPRGVPKAETASRNYYDVWLPDVAPSEALLKRAQASLDDPKRWKSFVSRYRGEMKRPEARRLLIYSPLCRTRPISRLAATAPTRAVATDRCCGNCWLNAVRTFGTTDHL
jgi:uncharacterized protein YeaO (DUF488 family)